MKERFTIADIFWRILLFLWAVGVVFPIFWILFISLKSNAEFFQSVWKFPEKIRFDNYAKAWSGLGIDRAFLNTVYYVGISMVISVIQTILASNILSRYKFKLRNLIYSTIMISLFLPGVNALVPTYVLMKNMGLSNSLTGLIIYSSLGLSPFLVMILMSFMATIPKEMEESAFMDGASHFQTLFMIIVPVCKPGIVTVIVYSFLNLYNTFLWPYILLTDPEKYTMSVKMYEINQRMQYQSNWVGLCAAIIIGLIPSIVFYFSMQKQVQEGMTLGALKG